jgi:hypothetical protein
MFYFAIILQHEQRVRALSPQTPKAVPEEGLLKMSSAISS